MWAQRGRHWRKGGGHGLKFDQGRAAFEVEDSADGCKKEDCLNISGKLSRKSCLKTCKVFMDDSGEYKPGTDRVVCILRCVIVCLHSCCIGKM